MKLFKVIKLDRNDYNYLIIANSYANPINGLLATTKIPGIKDGNVVFDLLLINGMKQNRFISLSVVNSKIDTSSIEVVEKVPTEVQVVSKKYFKKNSDLIRKSILPNSLKYTLLNDNQIQVNCQ